jgi:hypothetical protein
MSVDLITQAGTKFALHQWLDARGLGDNVQDTDPESETFGEYFYTHTDPGSRFYWWNHPSGVVTKSIDNTDPENPVAENYTGFFGLLKISGVIPADLKTWAENSTAVVSSQGLAGVGGEGIVIFDPEDLRSAVQAGGAPLWGGLLGVPNQWSDPRLWAFSAVMLGDVREFDGTSYESLINFNVWSPSQYPQGWQEVEAVPTAEWAVGTAYSVGDVVTYQGAEYECRQAHTAITGWTPAAVPALWLAL